MAKKIETSDRDELIQYIMENYYHTDDAKFHDKNLLYLQGMSDIELQVLYDSIK